MNQSGSSLATLLKTVSDTGVFALNFTKFFMEYLQTSTSEQTQFLKRCSTLWLNWIWVLLLYFVYPKCSVYDNVYTSPELWNMLRKSESHKWGKSDR